VGGTVGGAVAVGVPVTLGVGVEVTVGLGFAVGVWVDVRCVGGSNACRSRPCIATRM
jgi:uncharacterized membrane protein